MAIEMPHQARLRIQSYVNEYGIADLQNCLAKAGGVTLGDINNAVTTMETYCMGLHDALIAETMTWDQASTNLQGHFENIMPKISFPFPVGYTDIWGR